MSEQSTTRKISYRPEIDGLRAVSVLGVVLFHFQLGLPGGYVGVDVFFVISGFLITSIIVREIEENTFSIRNFWVRRIRRIFPAVSLLVVSVLFAGCFILDPGSMVNLAKSSVAQSLIISNVFFWRDTGYFSEAAELKPLLHTWSLSIEEQFYVCLPILLLMLQRLFKRGILPFLVMIFFVSLGLSIYGVFRSPGATFFLLPTRAWELLAGSIAAVGFLNVHFNRSIANILSAMGLLLVLYPMFLYSEKTIFPGLNAVPPVLGAALFIIANTGEKTLIGKLLSIPPVVFIGLISYSLYLWHWPIFSFSRHVLITTDPLQTTGLLLLTFALAVLSWKFVENPFRSTNRINTRASAFSFATIVTSFLLIVSAWMITSKGFPKRFDSRTKLVLEDVHWTGTRYKEEIDEPIGKIRLGKENQSPHFVLWGDSHAMLLSETFDTLSRDRELCGVGFITPACPPVPGLWMPGDSFRSKEAVLRRNKLRLEWIIERGIRHVFLVGRWEAMCGMKQRNETIPGDESVHKALMVVDSENAEVSREVSTAALRRQLSKLVNELNDHNVTVWILVQVPEIDYPNLAKQFSLKHRFPQFNGELPNTSPRIETYKEARADTLGIFRSLEGPDVIIIDPIDHFYTDGSPFRLHDSRAFYKNRDHLTRSGVDRFLKPLISEALTIVASQTE